MERCPVCGRTYGVTHSCPGPVTPAPTPWMARPAPTAFPSRHYFRQALAIARLEDAAIVAASLDKDALWYGLVIWFIGQLLVIGVQFLKALASGAPINWLVACLGSFMLISIDAAMMFAQYGICHLLARWWFGARGTYLGVLRALLLGSIVRWLMVIPYLGIFIAGLWGIAVMMVVFEDVDGIERLQAFFLSLGVGLIFLFFTSMLFAAGG